ncbi:ABC transporter ATP-binding protein [Advenella mimigardefordensis]|uniref:Putative high-affinity branched-chain amino acid transport ATP-binding protein BraG n=1 Tax=Advenella mimigardefordensis (strain DSM 17166 / LMG 22922 / DPN7) TaxID=1247726 RepID=W0PFT9_ADVMD|nr:ABC transporter ATP-binding protein [Advenella mimigardefordensis]AHG64155.1 putative high-affinity branched-chain amino acid transport ATP-binding protein BraG [Advenella mimigardefordensis DPN7]
MTHSSPALQIESLNAWYGDSHVLDNIALHVSEGETVTLLGRNGAGKTTTLRSIVGLVRRSGSIRLRGRETIKSPIHKLAPLGIGYVPEERGIFSTLSVEENLRLLPQYADSAFTVAEIYRLFPNLQERRHSQGTKLSGGEQQMLAIARVLRSGARILLLDEPTEGLAPVIVQEIGDLLKKLKSLGYTILLVEQNFRFAKKLADRFYVMENGKLAETLTLAELNRQPDVLDRYLGV